MTFDPSTEPLLVIDDLAVEFRTDEGEIVGDGLRDAVDPRQSGRS